MRRVSPKTRAKAKGRRTVREAVLYREKGLCEARIPGVCSVQATDVHEVLTRARGGDILDEDNCLALCRVCHSYITTHPNFAASHGFTLHAWEGDETSRHEAKGRRRIFRGMT